MKDIDTTGKLFDPGRGVSAAALYPVGIKTEGNGFGVELFYKIIHIGLVFVCFIKFEMVIMISKLEAVFLDLVADLVGFVDEAEEPFFGFSAVAGHAADTHDLGL